MGPLFTCIHPHAFFEAWHLTKKCGSPDKIPTLLLFVESVSQTGSSCIIVVKWGVLASIFHVIPYISFHVFFIKWRWMGVLSRICRKAQSPNIPLSIPFTFWHIQTGLQDWTSTCHFQKWPGCSQVWKGCPMPLHMGSMTNKGVWGFWKVSLWPTFVQQTETIWSRLMTGTILRASELYKS